MTNFMSNPSSSSATSSTSSSGIRRKVSLEHLLDRLLRMKPTKRPVQTLTAEECVSIADQASAVFASEPMLLDVSPPVNIYGDTHGQYFDLVRVLKAGGYPPGARTLFLGDYVDRGKHSIEVVALLFIYKILHPTEMFCLRGNHEEARVNSTYGFLSECVNRRADLNLRMNNLILSDRTKSFDGR